MTKIKNIFGAHPIAWSIALIVLAVVIIAGAYYAPVLGLKAADIPTYTNTSAAVGEEIPVGGESAQQSGETSTGEGKKEIPVSGEVTLAARGGKTLTLDTENVILTLTDDATGKKWTSGDPASANGSDKALLNISYLGDDNNLLSWNAFDNAVAFGTYKLYTIANGVRVELNINEGESQAFYEYLPQRMPIDRYENWMMPAIDEAAANGTLTESDAAKYKRTLGMVYKKNESEGCYIVAYAGNPPKSAVTQMINLVKAVNYTRELLIEDCAVYDIVPTFHEAPNFNVAVEFTLDENGDLLAKVPTMEAVTLNDFYRVQRIALLPNFGAVAAASGMDGYVLVPDGAGALMRFNTFDATIPEYIRPYYENDYYQDYYYMPEYGEELLMPVYGMLYGGETPEGGLLAIIEQGAETANLHVALASATGSGATYNRAYVSVDTLDYAKVKIYGAYSDNGATYLSDTGLIPVDFTVRYRPYSQGVTYFDLAKDYQAYLAKQAGTEVAVSEGPGVYLEAVGAVTLTERFMGIPYDAKESMTTYTQLKDMLSELPAGKLAVQYDGAFNGGMLSELNDGARLVKDNGTQAELADMMDAARDRGSDVMMQVNLSRVYKPGRTFLPYLHALRDFSNEAAAIYNYTPTTGIFNGKWDPSRSYYQLSPRYFGDVTDKFLSASKAFPGVAVGDLAHDFYTDYRYQEIVNPIQSAGQVKNSLEKLSSEKKLALHNPQANYAAMGKYAVDISRESSDYASFYATVPFRQLVLSGLTEVVGKDVNLQSRSLDYYLLQAAELGCNVKFTVTAKRADVLKNSHFEYLYAVWYDEWKDEIVKAMDECAALRETLGGKAIVGHRLLAPDVTETTYEGGVRVICNYTNQSYTSEDGEVAPMAYLICPEGGAL